MRAFFTLALLFATTVVALSGGCGTSSTNGPDEPDTSAEVVITTETRASGATVTIHTFPDGLRIHSYVSPLDVGASGTHIIEGPNELVLVDAQWFANFALDYRAYADSLGKPIERVVITHAHLDHYFGLTAGFADVRACALDTTRAKIEEEAPFYYELRQEVFGYGDYPAVVVPDCVQDEGAQMIDGIGLVVSAVEETESEQGILIELPAYDAMVVGDLVYNDVHLFLEKRDVSGWISALEALEADAPTYVLPGHGSPSGPEAIAFNIEYLETATELLATVDSAEAYQDGITTAYPDLGGAFFFDIFLPLLFPADLTDDVVELAVRRLNDGQNVSEFEAARDAFVAELKAQPGVGTDREFAAFFDFATSAAPDPVVFVGMTQYDNLDAFAAAGEALGTSPEAGAFFATFTPEAFTALRPLEAGTEVNLAGIASVSGQVLEVAVRDLSAYESFDQAAYETARDEFLTLLSSQPGFVAEYQWVSVLDPNIVVGMTVYESQEAFFGVLGNESFVNDPATAAFLFGYPPATAYVSTVVR